MDNIDNDDTNTAHFSVADAFIAELQSDIDTVSSLDPRTTLRNDVNYRVKIGRDQLPAHNYDGMAQVISSMATTVESLNESVTDVESKLEDIDQRSIYLVQSVDTLNSQVRMLLDSVNEMKSWLRMP